MNYGNLELNKSYLYEGIYNVESPNKDIIEITLNNNYINDLLKFNPKIFKYRFDECYA